MRYSAQHPVLLFAIAVWMAPAQGNETLEQEPITVQGNRALPGTLYIQPWKRVGEPLRGNEPELDLREETDPLERDTFQRELELHRRGYSIE